MSAGQANHVAGLALGWAATDALEQWVNAAPEGGQTPLEETISEYLGGHNPFPEESAVEVLRRDGAGWDQAVIVERVGVDEWTVEYEDGEQAWRDHHELRPTAADTSLKAPA
ncbi:tudor domain-containing protein [Pseudarthrobacter sp. CCNWLW207]|uniref:tudor domain-containing protein n=1 Tax=Pseudarthrobacter sp. CCNWLW207 TaxID=3127468 RepID=UPI003077D7BB